MSSTSRFLRAVVLCWLVLITAASKSQYSTNSADYAPNCVITRDVCVLGGGSAGTYTAIRLRELSKSVAVIEQQDRLGGHTNTYHDPATGATYDYGVQIFHNTTIVTNYFAHFNIPLAPAYISSSATEQFVDFNTGQRDTFMPSDPKAALEAYGVQLANYPYLALGFDLPDSVPPDLLLPFGDFARKYNISAAVDTIAGVCEGVGDFINTLTIYIMKYFNLGVVQAFTTGFLTTAHLDNSALYEAAQAELGLDVFLNSEVVGMDRDSQDGIKIVVKTPSGPKLLQVQKLVVAIPQLLDNLRGFDLDDKEQDVFSKFSHAYYYTTLIDNTNIPNDISFLAAGANTPFHVPEVPGPNHIGQTGIKGLVNVFYTSATYQSDDKVKQAIVADVLRLRNDNFTTTTPSFVEFADHSPFELVVPSSEIAGGFYSRLNALQGYRKTFYTGAALSAHDSSIIWAFTETLLSQITA